MCRLSCSNGLAGFGPGGRNVAFLCATHQSLYRLPHGQYAYNGHVINLPQDVACFANSLPHLPSKLDIIVIRKGGAANSHMHCDFRV